MKLAAGLAALALLFPPPLAAQGAEGSRNRPDRLEWFRDLGFGLFIHWSLDVQIGSVISHSLVGASEDYTRRFFELHPGVTPQEDAGLLELDRAQLRELLTHYGPIDIVFLDGPSQGLRELVWELQPDAVVTRGGMETPEQRIPGVPLDRPWEACLTMGTQWHYKPTHEVYKSGPELIDILIETRAKGGNLRC